MTYLLQHDSEKYILTKLLGEGVTCKCYLGQKITSESSELFAIKIFETKYYQYYSTESSFLSKLSDNENIIKLYEHGKGFFTPLLNYNNNKHNSDIIPENIDESKKEEIYFEVVEYAENGELKDYVLGTSTRIPEKISAKIFTKIILTVKYLHNNNIAHCDLKPENILFDKNYNPKLNDFGFSQTFRGDDGDYILHSFSGTTMFYCAPETRRAFTKGFNGVKNDIFSLGVLLFVITVGSFPFERTSCTDEKYKYIMRRNYKRFWEFFNYIKISDEFKDLINNMICLNPAQRLDLSQILEHPWLKKFSIIEDDDIRTQAEFEDDFYDKDVIEELSSRKI